MQVNLYVCHTDVQQDISRASFSHQIERILFRASFSCEFLVRVFLRVSRSSVMGFTQSKLVFDLVTSEGCKAELTWESVVYNVMSYDCILLCASFFDLSHCLQRTVHRSLFSVKLYLGLLFPSSNCILSLLLPLPSPDLFSMYTRFHGSHHTGKITATQ